MDALFFFIPPFEINTPADRPEIVPFLIAEKQQPR